MKKKTIIIESVILVTSIILLVLFLGLPQWLDLNKQANQQKNISQLTELSLATNKFLDKYMFSMTADLSRIKEKMEYSQRLNVPGDSKYQYLIYGGLKDADLRYVVSYDLFDLLNQYNKITDSNKETFVNSVNAYIISAKERMLHSPDKDKYTDYIGYLDLLVSKLSDDNYFRRARYTNTIVNPAFDANKVSMFGPVAQSFVGSELFKDKRQVGAIILYLAYINQVSYENASAETFNDFYTAFTQIFNYTNYYSNSAGNPLQEGKQPNEIKDMFQKEFRKFYLDSILYNDRLNKGIVAIGSNAAVEADNRLTDEFLNDLTESSYQKEVNQTIQQLITEYPGDYDGFANALREKINTYKMHDIDRQLIDIYESVFNYMQYQEYLHKSIYKQRDSFVQADFDNQFNDFFHKYILKYNKVTILGDLAKLLENEKKSSEDKLLSRFTNNNLLSDFREEMKTQADFLNSFYRSKSYSDIIAKSKKDFIDTKTNAFASQVRSEKLTIENIKKNISNDRIIEDEAYKQELRNKVNQWEAEFDYIKYFVSLDNPRSSSDNIAPEVLADSTNIQKQNKALVDKLNARINEAKDSYIRNDYSKYNSLFSYVDYCASQLISTISNERLADYQEFQQAVLNTTSSYIAETEYPEFDNELVSQIRNQLNDLYKKHTLEYASLPADYIEKLNSLNEKLTNHAEYQKFARAKRVSNKRILSANEIEQFKNVSIDPEGLIYFYNFYLYYIKDNIDKNRFYSRFGSSALRNAKKQYVDNKISANDSSWLDLEKELLTLLEDSEVKEKQAQFDATIKQALANYKDSKLESYKYQNAFNFNGLLSDLARVENNIKFYRGPIEFPFYDKDEFYLIYGRFMEEGDKKVAISLVSYTDIHNFPQANAVVVRNLGKTDVDVAAIQANLQKNLNSLIAKYQDEIVKLSQDVEEFKNINVIHNNDPDYKITTQTVKAKQLIRDQFTLALEQMLEDFVRSNY
jgi:hypothetical protein